MDSAQIRRLEELADRAWPPAETERGPGWEARFSHGMHRRLNSATVWSAGDLPETVAALEAWYAERGRPAIFKLTDASDPGLDGYLAARGYEPDARVVIMTRELGGEAPPPSHPVETAPSASEAWRDAFAGMYGYGPERRRLLGEVLDRIALPAAYATAPMDGEIAAVGMAVAEGTHAGVFEMATAPRRRGAGLGGAVLGSLLQWMTEQGAATAYLQVLEGNESAERLYRRAGFRPAYHYWYRVPPGWLDTMPR